MIRTLEDARKYEKEHTDALKKGRPDFHFSPYIGWMNDPNGFSYYKGQYHLFYQYYPYGLYWDSMHWGHAVSKDLLHWEYLPAALAPENEYDSFGIFSGSAIEMEDGRQLIMYTGVTKENDVDTQTQCMAVGDGLNYQKYEANPVLDGKNLLEGMDTANFRDPKIFKGEDGDFYCVTVAKKADGNGAMLMYHSADGFKWEFETVLLENKGEMGKMWECPDYLELDGKKLVIVSPQDMVAEGYKYHNGNGTVCFIGSYDKTSKKFIPESDASIDYGIDYYAPQTLKAPDGRTIMIGWMQNWDTNLLTDRGDRNWFGQMSLPREIWLQNNKLYQKPVTEIEQFRKNKITYVDENFSGVKTLQGIEGRCVDMEVTLHTKENDSFSKFTINLAQDDNHKVVLSYNPKDHLLSFDRRYSGTRRLACNQCECEVSDNSELKLRIIMDKYSVEVFVNDGEQVMTNTFYTALSAKGISFEVDGKVVVGITKYDLGSASMRCH